MVSYHDISRFGLVKFQPIDDSRKIRGVVITNSSKFTGDTDLKRLITYISEVLKHQRQDIAIHRFKNSMKQLVNLFFNITKPTVDALNGDIGQGLLRHNNYIIYVIHT